jgi:L-rhamnose-H+ transport protein
MSLALGVFYHWLGGLAAASFYIPYRAVQRWSWETYWLVGGFFSWIVAPSLVGALLVPDLYGHITAATRSSVMWSFFFGVLWGIGGITFGLTMRSQAWARACSASPSAAPRECPKRANFPRSKKLPR